MARVLDTASVRIDADIRRGERDAGRAGENYGRRFAEGADRETRRNPITPRIDDGFERRLQREIAAISRRVAADIPLTASGERFRRDVAARVAEIERNMRTSIPLDPVLAADWRRRLQRAVDAESRRVRTRVRVGVDVDRNRITQSLSSLAGLFGRFGERVSGVASTAIAPVNKVLGAFNLSLSGVITALTLATVAAPPLAAAIAVVGGAAVAAFGAISAGVVGLPVVLTSLLAPIAAITLGMDGIKRAAEPLKDEFQKLKDIINVTFELNMRPVFEKLQAIFPTLNAGLSETARAVSRVAMDFAGILTTPAGIENLRVSLAGVSDTIDRMRPGLRELFQALLNVAGTRELYDILGDTVGGVSSRFAQMIERVRSSGDLTGALEQLRDVLFSVSDLLFLLAEGAIKFFRAAGPGLKSFFDSLTATLRRVNWSELGESFGRMMERIGNAIEAVPPETWRQLADAVGLLAERFLQWLEGGGVEALIQGISTAAHVISFFAGNMLKVISVGRGFTEFLGGVKDTVGGAADSIGSAFSGVGDSVSESLDGVVGVVDEKLPLIPESVDFNLGGLPETIRGFFDRSGEQVNESVTQTLEDTDSAFSGFGQRFEEFFAKLPERIGYVMGFMSVTVALKSQEAVEGAWSWFSQLPDLVGGQVAIMSLRVQGFFQELPGRLQLLSVQAVGTVSSVFSELPGLVGAHAALTVERLRRFFSDLPGMLKRLASQAVESVVASFRELPRKVATEVALMIERVLRFFRELPGKLYRAGLDAIQGFIDGVKAKAASVVQAAKDVVSGAIRGARDALVSGSPSRVFRDLGKDTIQGYIIGLRERLGPLLTQIRSLFAQATEVARAAMPERMIQAEDGSWVPASFYTGGVRHGVGAALPQVDAAAIAAALSQVQWTAQFDGPNVIEIVNQGNRALARR